MTVIVRGTAKQKKGEKDPKTGVTYRGRAKAVKKKKKPAKAAPRKTNLSVFNVRKTLKKNERKKRNP